MHMDDDHRTSSLKLAYGIKTEYIKVDLSDLRCRLCDKNLPDLNATADHLNTVHGKTIDMSAKLGVMPFVLQKGCYVCALCQTKLPSLTVLLQHTITHFIDFACKVCGTGFMTEAAMIKHELAKHPSYEVSCSKSNEVFPNVEAKDRHRRMNEKCFPYTCSKCPERFNDWNTRGDHLKYCHCKNDPYRCVACGVMFTEEKDYYMHLKLDQKK
ncbi:unnamed protein product [Parnassius apollo]|uniref:(apollo) hypothetical protein n=1 Tax=Parnassius apollo TaxID=110799 RepID=A0A8S3Y8U0_PARAO|nr:unnamed protein product [Parnassius apollo]